LFKKVSQAISFVLNTIDLTIPVTSPYFDKFNTFNEMFNRITIEINQFIMSMQLKATAKAPSTTVEKKKHHDHPDHDHHKGEDHNKDVKNKYRFKQSETKIITQYHHKN